VIFVDEKTVSPADIGRLVWALPDWQGKPGIGIGLTEPVSPDADAIASVRSSATTYSLWFAAYVQTYLERDLRQLSAVSSLTPWANA